MNFNMYVPTNVVFGSGMLNELHKQALPGKKALLVISNGKSTRVNGYLDRTIEQLGMANAKTVVFDRIEANPLSTTVMAGAAVARREQCDFIVALGGGSCMDASKGIAAMATNEGELWDYVAFGSGKGKPFAAKPLPLVAVTTTAGTGSETDNGGVITNPATQEKTAIFSSDLFPRIAIVDPELMQSVPSQFTAYQGFDALFHSVEGYISTGANFLSDMYALTAIENVGRYLLRAVKNGHDLEAREHVAFANTLSGWVMCVGACTSEHSLEHALSAYHQALPHGAGLIMISKAYHRTFIEKGVRGERYVRMAKALGMADAEEPQDFIRTLEKLQKECGVAELKMSDYGISPDEFKKFAENARSAMSFLFDFDPVPLSVEDCVKIYADSYK